jgi:hypothetical protein
LRVDSQARAVLALRRNPEVCNCLLHDQTVIRPAILALTHF